MVKRNDRRKYLVDGRYQLTQVAVVLCANILAVLLTSAMLSWFYLIAWDGSVAVNHNQRIPYYIATCVLVVILCSVFFSLRRSRSAAGMMTILHTILDNARRRTFPECAIAFRKTDYIRFRQLAEPLNDCLNQLERLQASDYAALMERLEDLAAGIEKGEIDISGVQHILDTLLQTPRSRAAVKAIDATG